MAIAWGSLKEWVENKTANNIPWVWLEWSRVWICSGVNLDHGLTSMHVAEHAESLKCPSFKIWAVYPIQNTPRHQTVSDYQKDLNCCRV
jgi:hypothetical protein